MLSVVTLSPFVTRPMLSTVSLLTFATRPMLSIVNLWHFVTRHTFSKVLSVSKMNSQTRCHVMTCGHFQEVMQLLCVNTLIKESKFVGH